jgi:hypothetical protein
MDVWKDLKMELIIEAEFRAMAMSSLSYQTIGSI